MHSINGSAAIGGDIGVAGTASFGQMTAGTSVIAEISVDSAMSGGPSILATQRAAKSYADSGDTAVLAAAKAHADSITVHDFPPTEFTGIGPNSASGITIGVLPANQMIITRRDGAFDFSATGSGTVRGVAPIKVEHISCPNGVVLTDLIAYENNVASDGIYDRINLRMYTIPGVIGPTLVTLGAYAAYSMPGTTNTVMYAAGRVPENAPPGETSFALNIKYVASGTGSVTLVIRSKSFRVGGALSAATVISTSITASTAPNTIRLLTRTGTIMSPGSLVLVSITRNGFVDTNTANFYILEVCIGFRAHTWGSLDSEIT